MGAKHRCGRESNVTQLGQNTVGLTVPIARHARNPARDLCPRVPLQEIRTGFPAARRLRQRAGITNPLPLRAPGVTMAARWRVPRPGAMSAARGGGAHEQKAVARAQQPVEVAEHLRQAGVRRRERCGRVGVGQPA